MIMLLILTLSLKFMLILDQNVRLPAQTHYNAPSRVCNPKPAAGRRKRGGRACWLVCANLGRAADVCCRVIARASCMRVHARAVALATMTRACGCGRTSLCSHHKGTTYEFMQLKFQRKPPHLGGAPTPSLGCRLFGET
jgi:hypothetical protein